MNDGDRDTRRKNRNKKQSMKNYWSSLSPEKKASYTKTRVAAAMARREKAFKCAVNEAKDQSPPAPEEPNRKTKQGGFKTILLTDFLQQCNHKRIKKSEDMGYCTCKYQCGDDCYNKNAEVECTEDNCNVGKGCGNRWLSEPQFLTSCVPGEETHRRGSLGKGLKAFEVIPQDSIIGPYLGELLKKDQLTTKDYVSELGHGLYIDAAKW
mmetsp:Transcript_10657/g.23553  ORF Transcript_10657/g.23553 Transcript_10657/m.23553 type:complete len:209 (+) Transcript_10657:152-778(+)|eukprot:CAMPEP_0172317838 /NCGR_PEP_ID=MMETSP1058-20130122/33007_1 /TAXON_ID=83371 /ORGANISM="Detonula confervacea, Strain CCMP 353" /LENGTH=208 /DNA_ID=CAMNT_0013032497 /DNA_START=124 /DNA_END=750 /DNA_ORIENTATION=-